MSEFCDSKSQDGPYHDSYLGRKSFHDGPERPFTAGTLILGKVGILKAESYVTAATYLLNQGGDASLLGINAGLAALDPSEKLRFIVMFQEQTEIERWPYRLQLLSNSNLEVVRKER